MNHPRSVFLIIALGLLWLASCNPAPAPATTTSLDPPPPAPAALAKSGAEAPKAEAPAAAETASLGEHKLSLADGVVTAGSVRLELKTELPCHFHRLPDGKTLRVIQHEGAPVALVVCSKKKNETDCETVIRGLRSSAKGVELSPKMQRVAACPPTQWDEYMLHWFWYLKKPSK